MNYGKAAYYMAEELASENASAVAYECSSMTAIAAAGVLTEIATLSGSGVLTVCGSCGLSIYIDGILLASGVSNYTHAASGGMVSVLASSDTLVTSTYAGSGVTMTATLSSFKADGVSDGYAVAQERAGKLYVSYGGSEVCYGECVGYDVAVVGGELIVARVCSDGNGFVTSSSGTVWLGKSLSYISVSSNGERLLVVTYGSDVLRGCLFEGSCPTDYITMSGTSSVYGLCGVRGSVSDVLACTGSGYVRLSLGAESMQVVSLAVTVSE